MFGAVALVGAVGAASMQVMKGPVRAMSEVTKRTIAENNMIASSKLAVMAATNQANGGDCDGDMIVEPMPADAAGGLPTPAGGGLLPSSIGASLQDPWNTRYGLCSWDHGPDNGRCGGNDGLIAGGPTQDQYVLAVVSAGPDRQFQTSCNAWVDADTDNQPDVPLLVKAPGSDDIVHGYTYAEANSAGGGLWVLKSGDPDKATIIKDLEVRTADDSGVAFALDRSTGNAEFLALKSDNIYARTSPHGVITLNDPLRIKSVAGMAAPPGGGGGGAADNLGNHIATQGVQFFSAAGGLGVSGAETDPKVGAVTNNKWCRGDGTKIVCDQDAPSGGGGGNLPLWDAGLIACDAGHVGQMMFSDGALLICGDGGFRMISSSLPGAYTPAPVSTGGYFVATADATNGNLGGLAGANAFCLSQLTNNPWRGKGEAQARGLLVAGKVRAFLCDGSTCQNAQPNTAYTMASAYQFINAGGTHFSGHLRGGRTFTANASGQGPNAAMGFADETAPWQGEALTFYNFDDGSAGTNIWTGRSAGAANTWSNSPHANHCSNWTSTGGNGRAGFPTRSAHTQNWSAANTACNNTTNNRVVCFVDP